MLTQPPKPIWWRVIVGLMLIFIEIKNHIDPAPNLLKANNPGEQAAMNGTMVALIVLGCWLVYSGVKSLWRKN